MRALENNGGGEDVSDRAAKTVTAHAKPITAALHRGRSILTAKIRKTVASVSTVSTGDCQTA